MLSSPPRNHFSIFRVGYSHSLGIYQWKGHRRFVKLQKNFYPMELRKLPSLFSPPTWISGKSGWGDPSPQASLEALKLFCEGCEVHAAAVIVPGVNDDDKLLETCSTLEDWGAEALILMRFANYRNQGLILGNEPIIEGVEPHTLQEFEELVRSINQDFNLRVTGTPICDPENDSPFALIKSKNHKYLDLLSEVTSEATIVSSKVAAPFIERLFEIIGASDLVNVVAADQDIGCLITQRDLEDLDLKELERNSYYPWKSLCS